MEIDNKYIDHLRTYYTTILSQIITNDGRYLLAVVKNRKLAVFSVGKYLKEFHRDAELISNNNHQDGGDNNSISNLFSQQNQRQHLQSINVFPMERMTSLCSIQTTTKTFESDSQYRFIVGGVGRLKAFRLSMQNLDECEEEWMIKLPSDSTMINSLTMAGENKIVAGCGDSNIYMFDRETQQQTAKFSGHHDYIHSLKCLNNNLSSPLLYSCGEDGKILSWDYRSPDKPILSLEPFHNPELRRIQYGKWIGSIDVTDNNEWIVCGGGPKLSLWHLRSGKCAQILDTPGVIYSNRFIADNSKIMAAGTANQVIIWHLNDPTNPNYIDSSINTIYSIDYHHYDKFNYDLYTFAGDSHQIEVCKNAKFIDWKLYVS